MIRNTVRKSVALLFAVLMLLSLLLTTYAAQDTVDLNQTGTLQVHLSDPNDPQKPIDGTIELFKVAQAGIRNSNLTFSLTSEFAGSGVNLGDLTESALAQELADFAGTQGMEGSCMQTDEDGVAIFSQLASGVYLVTQDQTADGYYPFAPFLVSLPMYSSEEGGWLYEICASPKVQCPPQEPASLTVVKKWLDNEENRPQALTIYLLKDGEEAASVELTGATGWNYTWTELDADHNWDVREAVPAGYQASYSRADQTVTITNTASWYVPPEDILIQTGQMNWPVPVLACAGLLFLVIGCVLLRRGKENI